MCRMNRAVTWFGGASNSSAVRNFACVHSSQVAESGSSSNVFCVELVILSLEDRCQVLGGQAEVHFVQ